MDEFLYIHKIIVFQNNYSIIEILNEKKEISIIYNKIITLNYKIDSSTNKNIIQISNQNQTIYTNHIFRFIFHTNNYIEIDIDVLTDYLLKFNEIFNLNLFNYCTVCFTELTIKGIGNISHCDDICCKKNFYHLVTDNRVIESFNKDNDVFLFLIKIIIIGKNHPHGDIAFNPLPFVNSVDNLTQLVKIIPDELNFVNNNNLKQLTKKLQTSENDLDLYNKINQITYCLLKNAVSNNYFSMDSRKITFKNNSSIIIYMNYSAEIENKFNNNNYLFHGSSIYSWYPIIKNGLKVMSGTKLQANGAVYGKGIYLSNSFSISSSYSNGIMDGNNIVGVFEILDNPEQYKKKSNIFVVSDDSKLVLRSLVISNNKFNISQDISNYFIKEVPLLKKNNKLNIGILKNKRLSIEYDKLLLLNFIHKIEIITQFEWIITFIQIKNNLISIELKFSNYPIYPPDIKLKSKQIIGSNLNNIIKLDLINPANWKITSNLIEITTKLYNCFLESI